MMWKDLIFKLISMPLTRDTLNCVLRYLLAQPVEMDFMVLLFLIAEYTGLSRFFTYLSLGNNEEHKDCAEDEKLLHTEYVS